MMDSSGGLDVYRPPLLTLTQLERCLSSSHVYILCLGFVRTIMGIIWTQIVLFGFLVMWLCLTWPLTPLSAEYIHKII